jgi:hypothetical protein
VTVTGPTLADPPVFVTNTTYAFSEAPTAKFVGRETEETVHWGPVVSAEADAAAKARIARVAATAIRTIFRSLERKIAP